MSKIRYPDSLGTHGLIQKLCLKKIEFEEIPATKKISKFWELSSELEIMKNQKLGK